MTTYFVDYNVKKSGDGLTLETAFKTEKEAWDIIRANAPQNVAIIFEPVGRTDCDTLEGTP